jgi:DNA invertase Pin-like site-specific DNA recombinase
VFHVFGAIAHFERRLISERTKDGLASTRKHGRIPGRPPLPPATISALQDLVGAGKSVSQAAKHLGIGRLTAYTVIRSKSQLKPFAESSSLE